MSRMHWLAVMRGLYVTGRKRCIHISVASVISCPFIQLPRELHLNLSLASKDSNFSNVREGTVSIHLVASFGEYRKFSSEIGSTSTCVLTDDIKKFDLFVAARYSHCAR